MPDTILITGATGFVISNVTRHLAELGHEVVAADLVPPDEALREFWSGLAGPVSFRQLDVTDGTALRRLTAALRAIRARHRLATAALGHPRLGPGRPAG